MTKSSLECESIVYGRVQRFYDQHIVPSRLILHFVNGLLSDLADLATPRFDPKTAPKIVKLLDAAHWIYLGKRGSKLLQLQVMSPLMGGSMAAAGKGTGSFGARVLARAAPPAAPKPGGGALLQSMSPQLRRGIISPAPPVVIKGGSAAGGAVVRKTVETATTFLGRTRFGRFWGAASIRAQEQALIKLEAAGVNAAKIRQSFSESGELVMDYVGRSVQDQWAIMGAEAKEAYRVYVNEARTALGRRLLHDLKARNIAYQLVSQDGQIFHRFIAFDPALDNVTIVVGIVGGTVSGLSIGSLVYYALARLRGRSE